LSLKSFLRRTFAALGVSLLVAGAAQAKAPPAAHPALWAVSDADTTVYLFGTIHLLPKDYRWRTARFEQAIASSQELVIETIVDPQHPEKIQAAEMSLGFSRGLPPIAERVPPAEVPRLRATIAKSGVPEKFYDQMDTWLAAVELLGVRFREMGLGFAEGPEETLRETFTAAKKPIGELETNAEQLAYFDRLPEKEQRMLLEGAIEQPQSVDKDFNQMLSAWSRGDVAGIGKTFNHDLSASPELKAQLLEHRNANWSRWIEKRMAEPGTIMVAVGAGHLAGPDSLVELLKREGYKVSRLQ
jgi:uncharacterized protein